MPQLARPSFAEATVDAAGNIAPKWGALTKKAKLLSILGIGAQSVGDAITYGHALDAPQNGWSPFGRGWAGATIGPIARQQDYAARQRQGLQDQELANRVAMAPIERDYKLAQVAGAQSEIPLRRAMTANYLRLAGSTPAAPQPTLEIGRAHV